MLISALSQQGQRRAAVLPLTCLLLVVLVAMLAFTIDLGMICMSRTELQRTSDSAALAATQELVPPARPMFPLRSPYSVQVNVPPTLGLLLQKDLSLEVDVAGRDITIIKPDPLYQDLSKILPTARTYASSHRHFQSDSFDLLDTDVTVFKYPNTTVVDPGPLPLPLLNDILRKTVLAPPDDRALNAVRVTARKDDSANEPLHLAFAPILGVTTGSVQATSEAAILKGYGVVPNVKMLPMALDITVWRALRLGNGTVNGIPLAQSLLAPGGAPIVLIDEQSWNPDTRAVQPGSDQIWEVILLTDRVDTLIGPVGLPGTPLPSAIVSLNLLGTNSQPSISTLKNQVREGPTASEFGADKLYLPFERYGFPNVPTELFDELNGVIGKPRLLPLYETLPAAVNNTVNWLLGLDQKYRIVGFAGVIVTETHNLLGLRYIKIQPAPFVSSKVLPAKSNQSPSFSDCVYTAPLLVK